MPQATATAAAFAGNANPTPPATARASIASVAHANKVTHSALASHFRLSAAFEEAPKSPKAIMPRKQNSNPMFNG